MSLALSWLEGVVFNTLSFVFAYFTIFSSILPYYRTLPQQQHQRITMSHLENPQQQLNLDVDNAQSDAGSSVDERSNDEKKQDAELANRSVFFYLTSSFILTSIQTICPHRRVQ